MPQGCSYAEKCQFAHGEADLRPFEGKILPQKDPIQMKKQLQNNPLNYKIVKCKNWEKDGTCKYGTHCTFAHGDSEIRQKADNLYQIQPFQMMFNPYFAGMNPMIMNKGMQMGMPMMNPMKMMRGGNKARGGKNKVNNNRGKQA